MPLGNEGVKSTYKQSEFKAGGNCPRTGTLSPATAARNPVLVQRRAQKLAQVPQFPRHGYGAWHQIAGIFAASRISAFVMVKKSWLNLSCRIKTLLAIHTYSLLGNGDAGGN